MPVICLHYGSLAFGKLVCLQSNVILFMLVLGVHLSTTLAAVSEFHEQEMGVSSLNLPVKPDLLILFIAHLYCRGYASSTVLTYISAIAYVHRLAGLPDPTESHLIKTALKGYVNDNFTHLVATRKCI